MQPNFPRNPFDQQLQQPPQSRAYDGTDSMRFAELLDHTVRGSRKYGCATIEVEQKTSGMADIVHAQG